MGARFGGRPMPSWGRAGGWRAGAASGPLLTSLSSAAPSPCVPRSARSLDRPAPAVAATEAVPRRLPGTAWAPSAVASPRGGGGGRARAGGRRPRPSCRRSPPSSWSASACSRWRDGWPGAAGRHVGPPVTPRFGLIVDRAGGRWVARAIQRAPSTAALDSAGAGRWGGDGVEGSRSDGLELWPRATSSPPRALPSLADGRRR